MSYKNNMEKYLMNNDYTSEELNLIVEKNADFTENSRLSESNIKRGLLKPKVVAISALAIAGLTDAQAAINIDFSPDKDQIEFVKKYSKLVDCPYQNFITDFAKIHIARYTKSELFEKILSFKSLVNNWDGYNAIPLEVKSSTNAIELINLIEDRELKHLKDIYPNPNGTVSFEWENEADEIISLEMGNKSFSYFIKLNSQEPQFFNDIQFGEKEIKILSKQISQL